MKKCVKIVLAPIRSADKFLNLFKKTISLTAVEGLIEFDESGDMGIELYGEKEAVNILVDDIEALVIRYNLENKESIGFSVEPFVKNEDYRGVVRFIRRGNVRLEAIRKPV